jgi:CheY-like chemotaxis protein
MNTKHRTTRRVLVVDDDPDHRLLAQMALRQHANGTEVSVDAVPSGEDALAYLRREGAYADSPRPHLVLLDLRMPGLDGFGVLRAVRTDPELRDVPVVVLSSSDHPDDVKSAYGLGSNSYITKQASYRGDGMRAIADYWFERSLVPEPAI